MGFKDEKVERLSFFALHPLNIQRRKKYRVRDRDIETRTNRPQEQDTWKIKFIQVKRHHFRYNNAIIYNFIFNNTFVTEKYERNKEDLCKKSI